MMLPSQTFNRKLKLELQCSKLRQLQTPQIAPLIGICHANAYLGNTKISIYCFTLSSTLTYNTSADAWQTQSEGWDPGFGKVRAQKVMCDFPKSYVSWSEKWHKN